MASQKKDAALFSRLERARQGLGQLPTTEAKAALDGLNARVVAYNHAMGQGADSARPVEADLHEAERNLKALLAVTPFVIKEFEPGHLAHLPQAEDFANIGMTFHAKAMVEALACGGEECQRQLRQFGRALEQHRAAEARLKAARAEDQRTQTRRVVARKELVAAVMTAEAFVHAQTEAEHPARAALKRPYQRAA